MLKKINIFSGIERYIKENPDTVARINLIRQINKYSRKHNSQSRKLSFFTFKIVRIKDTNTNIIGITYIPYIKFQIKDIVAVAKAEDICNTLSLDTKVLNLQQIKILQIKMVETTLHLFLEIN